MIEIKNLTKIYDKTKEPVKALNNVSLVLPDKGFIFVLGKSGSGKSTFLNMLGGLDNSTSGDILLNGMSIVNLKDSELDRFRNDYIGIIYQNFNLFPTETVKENIMTSSILSSKEITCEDIRDICNELDLADKENVLVKNLSGGQKQRVAIARALIKDPELILADEPTGNLDSKTTKIIFNILKKISKEKLVVVISHDIASAEKYADRIIYLSDGKVVDDVRRNKKYKDIGEDDIQLPKNREFSDKEVENINESLSKYNLKVSKPVEKFVHFDEEITIQKETPVFAKHNNILNLSMKVSTKFFKSTVASFVLTLVMLTFIIGILSLSQTFAQFDGAGAVYNIASDFGSKNFIVNKAYSYYNDPLDINKSYSIQVNNNDIENFKKAGYVGNIYNVYNTPVIAGASNLNNETGKISSNSSLYSGIYSITALGTVVCDYDYLKYLYGDIKVLAGSLYGLENNSKLIVTDYFADSILMIDMVNNTNQYISMDSNDPYQKITNTLLWNRYQIGAIIDTGYKERYAKLFEGLQRIKDEPQNSKEITEEITRSKLYIQFFDELNSSLNFTYSINSNFYEDYIAETQNLAIWFRNCILSYDGGRSQVNFNTNAHIYSSSELEDNTILMNYKTYNNIFDKNVSLQDQTDFEEKEIEIFNYAIEQDTREEPRTLLKLKVVGVTSEASGDMGYIDRKSYEKLASDALYSYSLIFDNIEQIFLINETAKNNFFYTTLQSFSSIFEVCKIIDIFSSVFLFIAIGLIVIALMMIISHNLRTIKKNQYRIGVYKGLGCPSKVFALSCLYNTLTLVLTTFVTSIVFVAISSKFINNILVQKFQEYINSKVVAEFTFVGFSITNLCLYILVILLVGGVSLFAPFLKLRKLKPNLIINKAE